MNHHPAYRQVWFWVLVTVSICAALIGVYSAVKIERSAATCDQLNRVIRQQNIRGEVLQRLLINAADTREASARLESNSTRQRRIDQRAAFLYRADVELVIPTKPLKC